MACRQMQGIQDRFWVSRDERNPCPSTTSHRMKVGDFMTLYQNLGPFLQSEQGKKQGSVLPAVSSILAGSMAIWLFHVPLVISNSRRAQISLPSSRSLRLIQT